MDNQEEKNVNLPNFTTTRDKIMQGIHLAFERLVQEKSLRDEELFFSKNGEIVAVKARDLLKN
jgi:hypothetical protein